MRHMVDLYAGLGGASEAFIQDINWRVLRFDNNPLLNNVPCMVMQDVKSLRGSLIPYVEGMKKIDLIWASPPCREFSGGYNSPKSQAVRDGLLEQYKPDMSLLESAIEIIDIVKPKYWVIENVIGSIRYFEKYLGKPRQIIGPYVLWGNFPFILPGEVASKASKDVHSSDPLRANKKAKVDFSISKALKDAIEQQKSLFEY